MKAINTEKISTVIRADIAALIAICDMDIQIWNDDDIEMIMERHELSVDEAVALSGAVLKAYHMAHIAAVKAADKAAAEAVNRMKLSDEYDMNALYHDVWNDCFEAIRTALHKSLSDKAIALIQGK